MKLFFFGMSGSWSAGNDFVDNYDRYMREHDQTLKREATVGLAERVISMQVTILEHSTLMRRVKYYWGPMIKSILVADPGEYRMEIALKATKESLDKLDDLSRRVGFDYKIYLLPAVHDILRGTHGKTLAMLNPVSPKPVVATAELFLDSPQDFSYAFDGHLNAKGSRRVAEFLTSIDQP